eukprot:XP_001689624.1 predicted protein [Chlamydomonas reinhardtii]
MTSFGRNARDKPKAVLRNTLPIVGAHRPNLGYLMVFANCSAMIAAVLDGQLLARASAAAQGFRLGRSSCGEPYGILNVHYVYVCICITGASEVLASPSSLPGNRMRVPDPWNGEIRCIESFAQQLDVRLFECTSMQLASKI